MTPDPHPTKTENADELDSAARIADHRGDILFAKQMRDRAQELRAQDDQEAKNGK